MVVQTLFKGIYKGKTVLVTGHTGFKGSWLVYWLQKMGANVIGYSLHAPTEPNHISLLNLDMISIYGDIKNIEYLDSVFKTYQPDIVFHLAAQALVRESYEYPIETYETNVLGTLKVFEVCKKYKVKAIVNVTSDKAYENREWLWGYRETDMLGGYDPYSSSKACAEILTSSYRESYFHKSRYKKTHNTLLSSCRAGNVIGGGDWAKNRLLSDIMVATSQHQKVAIRNPKAVRPWQFVLEPLSGYLLIGQKLLEEESAFATAMNFGPSSDECIDVEAVVKSIKKEWSQIEYEIINDSNQPHEAHYLKLDCSKAHSKLSWKSVWNIDETLKQTVKWYRFYYEQKRVLTNEILEKYVDDATKQGMTWTKN